MRRSWLCGISRNAVLFLMMCTVNELLSMSQRFEVAKMLRDKRTYQEITEYTGASTATISRVNRSLNYGNDGYQVIFKRLEEKGTDDQI